jgi:hypothetical protein
MCCACPRQALDEQFELVQFGRSVTAIYQIKAAFTLATCYCKKRKNASNICCHEQGKQLNQARVLKILLLNLVYGVQQGKFLCV